MENNIIEIDKSSDRVVAFIVTDPISALRQLKISEQQHKPSKIFVYLKRTFLPEFEKENYVVEGTMKHFFSNEDAILVSKFLTSERRDPNSAEKNQEVLKIVNSDTKCFDDLEAPKEITIELLKAEDIKSLTELYKMVFPQYPTNIYDPTYIAKAVREGKYVFVVAKTEGKVVAAASAMLTPYGGAEITDCATDPAYRGKQLLASIIIELEKELISRGVYMFYSITRAISVGMNMTVKRLRYQFEGTLVKNCVISSGLEDMNVWTKYVK